MATLSRIARIRLTTGVGAFREWTATAATEETSGGQSVTITWTITTSGATPPDPETTAELRFYSSSGTLINTIVLTANTTPQTATFFFTATGVSGGGARSGTVEIAAYVRRVVAGTTIYEIESDGTPNNPGPDTSTTDRGYIVGTATTTAAISNVAYAGAKNQPAEEGESLFYRQTVTPRPYRNEPLTLAIGSVVSASVSSNTTTFDLPAQTVDDRFPAAVSTQTTAVTIPNNTGFVTGRPWTTFVTNTTDSITVDPRIDAESHLWQADDDVMGTPPMSKHDSRKSALVSSYSGMAMRVVRARTRSGVNGLSYSLSLDPVKPGSTIVRTGTTATRGGQDGWTDLAQLGPFVIGGSWAVNLDITAPTGIDNDAHLLNGTDTVSILSPDPRVQIRGYLDKLTAQKGHFKAGEQVVVSMAVLDHDTLIRIDPSRVTNPRAVLVRYRASDHRYEFLAADGVTWTTWEPTAALTAHTLAPSANDPRNYIKEFTSTASWTGDVANIMLFCQVDGVPVYGFAAREETGDPNDHGGYKFDPIGLFK